MRCLDVKNRLQEWLDERAPASALDPSAQAHLGQCNACREQFAAAQRLVEGVKLFPRPAASSVSSRSIVARVLQDRAHRQLRFQRRLKIIVALAASILIMVISGYILVPGPKKVREPGPFAAPIIPGRPTPKVDPDLKDETPPAFAKTVDEAKGKVAALTEKWTDRTMGHARHLLAATPALELPPMSGVLLPEESLDATASLKKAGHEISEGFQPVTRSARRALNLFVRELATLDVTGAN